MANKTQKHKKSLKVSKNTTKSAEQNKNINEIKYLHRLIELSLRNVGKSEQLDKLFTDQANRIKEEITKLKLV